jgi:Bacteriophage HK97-gp10, putative tail-component
VNLAEFAAAARAAAGRAEESLAVDCARVAAREYLAALHVTTPVQSGALRASERVFSVSGSGTEAAAVVGSELVYARFRNYGGTIRVKRARVLTDGTRFFGREVHQHGSHYIEAAEGEAAGPIRAACQVKLDEFLRL